jgi:parallel beta-helix repeat protein
MTLTLLVGILGVAVRVQKVEATATIHIRADGSVDPPDAPIQRDGDVYSFTDDINRSIVVERDNIVIDGVGYALQGTGTETGIDLSERSNVTIKNMEIRSFEYAIQLDDSTDNSIFGTKITTSNWAGIGLLSSSNNTIVGNNITNNCLDKNT